VSFDDTGNCVIVRDGLLDIDDRCTKIDAFDFDDYWLEKASVNEKMVDQEQIGAGIFTFSKGNRFNAKGHDWLIFDNYLSLSFSYVGFVIKDMIERNDPSVQRNQFDFEAYNYLFNQRTSFTDSKFITEDSDELVEVLDEFEKGGRNKLCILNYTRPIKDELKEESKGGPERKSTIM
jgi:hypothetical protein